MICDYELRTPAGELVSRHRKFSAAATACLRLRNKGTLCDIYDCYWKGMVVPSGTSGIESWPKPYGDHHGIAVDQPRSRCCSRPTCLRTPYWKVPTND